MKKPLVVPKFKSDDEESEFWVNLDLTEYFEPSDFQSFITPNLKPSSTPISIRIPDYQIARVKQRANALGVPYQSLLKQYIDEGLAKANK